MKVSELKAYLVDKNDAADVEVKLNYVIIAPTVEEGIGKVEEKA